MLAKRHNLGCTEYTCGEHLVFRMISWQKVSSHERFSSAYSPIKLQNVNSISEVEQEEAKKHRLMEVVSVNKSSRVFHIGNSAKRTGSRMIVFERASPLNYMDWILRAPQARAEKIWLSTISRSWKLPLNAHILLGNRKTWRVPRGCEFKFSPDFVCLECGGGIPHRLFELGIFFRNPPQNKPWVCTLLLLSLSRRR